MTSKETTRVSKFLSLILRHEPVRVGLSLDDAGWVRVSDLLRAVNGHGVKVTKPELEHVVATNEKKRFEFSQDGQKIRASQRHSIEMDVKIRTPKFT